MRRLCLILGLALPFPAAAADAPLTLAAVLACAGQPHPDLDAARSDTDLARAGQLLAESQNDFRLTLSGSLATGHNPLDDRYSADNVASLDARKLLFDGGRARLAGEAATLETQGREEQYLDALAQRRLTLMTRFFDVLLTDQQYAADNEFAAAAYVNFDNGKDRHRLGEISDAALAELESRFQDAREKRENDLRQARIKRSLLANAMNQPGQLPSDLADPELKDNDRPLPDLEVLRSAMLAHNPRLQAQDKLLAAGQKRLEAQRAGLRPSLELAAGAATYSRETLTRDDLHAGLNLTWPLYLGRQNDALVAQEQARLQALAAQRDRLRLDLDQSLRDTYETIEYLRNAARSAAAAYNRYRDLALDRSRAEFELELKTNLGTSMAEIQVAQMRSRAVEYQLALALERLDGLLGQPLDTLTTKDAQ